jgi:hypothetical protein
MKPTKLVKANWPSDSDRMHPLIITLRAEYIRKAVAENKTDGIPVNITDKITTRTWADQASAEDWCKFITELAGQFNIPVTTVIEDLPN